LVAFALLLSASPTWAAEAAQANPIEELVVSASRIERPDFSYSNPVISITADDIRAGGVRDMAHFLKQTPALVGSLDSHDLSGPRGPIGANGLTALNLRNLGVFRTLVLVNGRRYVRNPFPGADVVDIETLPAPLIERVEVMTGGASALYGSDGVSGVVNFVMKERFEGLDIVAQGGTSSENDANSASLSATFGTAFADDRGHVSLGFVSDYDQRVFHDDRDFASGTNWALFVQNPDNPAGDPNLPDLVPLGDIRFFDFSYGGAVDVSLDAIPEFDGDGSPWDPGRFIEPFYGQGGDGVPLVEGLGDLVPDNERYAFTALLDYALTDKVSVFADINYSNRRTRSRAGFNFDYVLVFEPDTPYAPQNILDAADGAPLLMNRDHGDFGTRKLDTERDTVWAVIGLDGDLGKRFGFEVSYTYGEADVDDKFINNRYNDRFAAALDTTVDPESGEIVCRSELDPAAEPFNLAFQEWNTYTPLPGTWAGSFTPGAGDCVPMNVFGDGSPSVAAVDWVNLNTVTNSNFQQHVVQGYLHGDSADWYELPAGPVGIVIGAEWRREKVEINPAAEDEAGLTYNNILLSQSGDQEVAEAFAEIDVPLLTDVRFARQLSVDAAIRYSSYSDSDNATTWKAGVVWQPFASLTLRGTVAEATRAPSLQELITVPDQTFETIVDPCDINQLQNGTAFRSDNCAQTLTALGIDPTTYTDPNFAEVEGRAGGNLDLGNETADTYTWGIIYTPASIEGLTINMDWYDIELEDAIEFILPQDSANLCVDLSELDNKFCDLLEREPGTGGIVDFLLRPENVSELSTRGVDFGISYATEFDGWGAVRVALSGHNLQKFDVASLPGEATVSEAGQVFKPEWQANFDLQWQRGNVLLRYQAHYFDETKRFDETTTNNNPNVVAPEYLEYDRKLTHDVFGSYRFNGPIDVYGGIRNLTNEEPGVGEVFYPVSGVGRYFFAGVAVSLGPR
jgi:outer membrane receptor protein involved in Fe transport